MMKRLRWKNGTVPLRSWYDICAKPNMRVATADRYHLMIEQYTIPRIGSIKITKLAAHDLQKLYKELMESGRTNRKSGHTPNSSCTSSCSSLLTSSAMSLSVQSRSPRNHCL